MTAAASPSSVSLPALDGTRCPLCGLANQCAMEMEKATGQAQPPCWCTQADVSFNDALLTRVPAEARRLACICAACARASAASPTP